MLDRVAAVDRTLKSYVTVMPDRALAAARRAEAEIQSGQYRGPLHGMPIGVKDLCYTPRRRHRGRHENFLRLRSGLRRDGRDQAAGRRRSHSRQADALRRRIRALSPRAGSAGQSVESRAVERRFIERLRRCGRGWPLLRLHRHGYWWVDPVSIRRKRLRRLEADLRTREPAWSLSARRVDGSCRSNGQDCRRTPRSCLTRSPDLMTTTRRRSTHLSKRCSLSSLKAFEGSASDSILDTVPRTSRRKRRLPFARSSTS